MRYTIPPKSKWQHFKNVTVSGVGEDVEKKVPSYFPGSSVNWYKHCREESDGI